MCSVECLPCDIFMFFMYTEEGSGKGGVGWDGANNGKGNVDIKGRISIFLFLKICLI